MKKSFLSLVLLALLFALPVAVFAQDGEDDMDMTEDVQEDDSDGIPMTLIAALVLSLGGAAAAWMGLRNHFQAIDYAIIGLTLFTALIHIRVGIPDEPILLLNGIGYGVLLVALYLPQLAAWRLPIVGVLIIYTLITFVGYFATHDHYDDNIAISSKIAEALLMIFLAGKARNLLQS